MKKFTLVTTVFNEASRLKETIADIEAQSLHPDEIIIVDAGSNDNTLEILNQWSDNSSIEVKVVISQGANVAQGRNLAIKNASHELIVSTDFGCRYHPEWLRSIVTPFENDEVKVVGGNYTVLEEDIKTLSARANYILSSGYKYVLEDGFIPSSRSIAYYRTVWEEVGGYPEELTLAGDDYKYGLDVMEKGYSIFLVQEAYVYWGRHDKFIGYGKEAFRYGLGDGEAGQNKRNFFSHILETTFRYLLLLRLLAIPFLPISYFEIPVLVILLLGLRSYLFAFRKWLQFRSKKYNLKTLIACFWSIEISRIYYIRGHIKGMLNPRK